MDARDILIRPLITEKSTQLMEEGKYVFVVAKKAIVKLAPGETIEFFQA